MSLGLGLWAAQPLLAQSPEASKAGLPRTLSLDEPGLNLDAPTGAADSPFLDFGRLEAEARLSVLGFSSDFHSGISVGGGLFARAPLSWLSRDVLGLPPYQIGAFTALTVSTISRDLSGLSKDSGMILFYDLGLDFTFLHGDEYFVLAQLGSRFGYFGGVTDLDNGVALLLGVMGGLRANEKVWVTLDPQIAFGNAGSVVYSISFGFNIHF